MSTATRDRPPARGQQTEQASSSCWDGALGGSPAGGWSWRVRPLITRARRAQRAWRFVPGAQGTHTLAECVGPPHTTSIIGEEQAHLAVGIDRCARCLKALDNRFRGTPWAHQRAPSSSTTSCPYDEGVYRGVFSRRTAPPFPFISSEDELRSFERPFNSNCKILYG